MEKLNKNNFVSNAEKSIIQLKDNDRNHSMTNSKLRNILEMTNMLQTQANRERKDKLSEDIQSNIQYVKMKIAYEVGRTGVKDKCVKEFLKEIMSQLDQIGDSREQLGVLCKYMESIVAYHKYYGGRD